jgi:DNA polymerase III epsilon subunit-like protein
MLHLLRETALRCPGGKLPDSYLILDSETNGLIPREAVILQYGFGIVIHRELVDHFSIMINHGNIHLPPEAVAVNGITHERMAREGVDPVEGLRNVFEFLNHWKSKGMMFVGHNMSRFDAPFIEYEEHRPSAHKMHFEENSIIDTGALVKGAQIGMRYSPTNTLRSFAYKVTETYAPGVKWALHKYCWDRYNLGERTGLDKDAEHDAGDDCMLTYHVFETLRKELGE